MTRTIQALIFYKQHYNIFFIHLLNVDHTLVDFFDKRKQMFCRFCQQIADDEFLTIKTHTHTQSLSFFCAFFSLKKIK